MSAFVLLTKYGILDTHTIFQKEGLTIFKAQWQNHWDEPRTTTT